MLTNLRVFNISVKFYKACEDLNVPKHLQDQLLRASSSISLNLAEGYGKKSFNDQRKFFFIAMGSLRECQAILILIGQKEGCLEYELADSLGASIYKLIKAKKSDGLGH